LLTKPKQIEKFYCCSAADILLVLFAISFRVKKRNEIDSLTPMLQIH